ncbi:MAG TPA: response regulator [Syntrophales bacterium]|nr:response regulator [Syntrophales bacterium]
MKKLLIVDDDLSILRVLKMRLESEGYQIEAASDIEAAKDLALGNEYELAILDMKLPSGSGIELMKSIHEIYPGLPVIILTAYGTIESAVEAMKEGAYVYLKKPFDYRSLLFQIRNAIEKAHLKDALAERTAKLEEINKELESFSYSVSHDLRAPLRAIDGYARMILKKQVDKFDEDTLKKFNAIRSNVHMMDELIDDLLAFSRLGKMQMVMSKIDMDQLVRDVWKELQAINPERNITLNIRSMPSGYGDRKLIRQVYSNLFDNAVKFTKNRDPAYIEVGGYTENEEDIFYVKDNGVGFDMAYCDKLFGIFQRLHSGEEFEGTGVGLATIQRIISRHGGRVWAESRVNEGATFYFSLP